MMHYAWWCEQHTNQFLHRDDLSFVEWTGAEHGTWQI
jgi:hypothetical protein